MKIYILLTILILAFNTNIHGNTSTLRVVDNSFKVEELQKNFIKIENRTLYPVREIITNFGYDIKWDNLSRVATINREDFTSYITKYTVYKNHIYLSIDDINKHLENPIYVSTSLNLIYPNKNLSHDTLKALLPSYNGYTKEDLLWLSKIVSAESRGEHFSAQVDVANVIINRVASNEYPNTIYNVIFDNENGVQFTPTINGHIYNEPTLSSYLAALEVLEHTDFAREKNQNALFFINPITANSSWVHNNRGFAFANGNHNFYH